MRVKPDRGEVGVKQRDWVTDWSEYDKARVNRGSLRIWFDDASSREQWTAQARAASGTAIQTSLTIKALFHLPYRATEALVRSLMMRLGQLDLPMPGHMHLARRG